jgi:hypothetical protein
MRDLSVKAAGDQLGDGEGWSLEQLIEAACAGISAIAPWRDIVQAAGVARAGTSLIARQA